MQLAPALNPPESRKNGWTPPLQKSHTSLPTLCSHGAPRSIDSK